MNQLYKLTMIDGWSCKVTFKDVKNIHDVGKWLNSVDPFINVKGVIINLKYVKRIKRVKRLRDYLLNITLRNILIWTTFWFIVSWLMVAITIL